jgi:hypothetical protein
MSEGNGNRLALVLTIAAVGVVVAGHVGFLILDPRLPRDLGLYYSRIPHLYDAMGHLGGGLRAAASAVTDVGGGYQVLLAGYLRLVGRGATAFQLVDLGWLVALLVVTGVLARRIWGPWAGLTAVLLAGATPAVFVYARTAWIHVPEAALLMGVVLAWRADPGLTRRRTVILAGLLGAAALLLRPSALIWLGLLVAATAWGVRRGAKRPHKGHTGALLAVWALATLPAVLSLDNYLQAKLEARGRYAAAVPDLSEQLFVTIGPVAAGVMGLGALLTLWPPRRRGTALLWLWSLTPVPLFALFRAGIDNFTVAAVALATLGAAGLSRRPVLGIPLAVAVFTLAQLPQWLPAPAPGSWAQHTAGRLGLALKPSFRNPYVPHTAGHGAAVQQLLAATCPGDERRCVIAVDQGLFQPFAEDPGALELFLAGHDAVEIAPVAGLTAPPGSLPIRALAHYECPEMDQQWRERYPGSIETLNQLVTAHDLRPVWGADVGEGCQFAWLAPGGQVAAPESLPDERTAEEGPTELPPTPLSPIRVPWGAAGPEDADRAVLRAALERLLAGSLEADDRQTLADFVQRIEGQGGIWRRQVVTLYSTDGDRFEPLADVPPMPSAAAPAAALGDDGQLYLFTVDGDLSSMLDLADQDPGWFARHGVPGPGALRLQVSQDGRSWQPVPGFGIEGLAGMAVMDPAVARAPDGSWRLYYVGFSVAEYLEPKSPHGSTPIPLHVAESDDLIHWRQRGTVAELTAPGPTVFFADGSCTLLTSGVERWTSADGGDGFVREGHWEARGFGPAAVELADGRTRVYFDSEHPGFPVAQATRDGEGQWTLGEATVVDGPAVSAVTVVGDGEGGLWMFAERSLGPPGR